MISNMSRIVADIWMFVPDALAAIGDSNADNWVVVQKGVPLLIQMLQAPDLAQAEAAVRAAFPVAICFHSAGGSTLAMSLTRERTEGLASALYTASSVFWCCQVDTSAAAIRGQAH